MDSNLNKEETTPSRLLGIDYGSKRVGVAVSDSTGKFALPVSVLTNSPDLENEIEKIALDNEVSTIVLGESLDFKGKANEIMLDIIYFKERMEAKGFIVIFEPEILTSVQAEKLQGKNAKSDASAAALILQSYLDREILK